MLTGVVHYPGIGNDQGINVEFGSAIHSIAPCIPVMRLGKGVECDKDPPVAGVGKFHCVTGSLGRKIQAGEVTRIGRVAKTQIDRVCAVRNRSLQALQAAGRTDKFHQSYTSPGRFSWSS